jgi:KaiC/GvpD/RAD55 family RecA-like ATPase
MKVSDWSIGQMKAMKASIPEAEKRWLHIDDDHSVALQYNKEEDFIDFMRTRSIPIQKAAETVVLWGFLSGTASVPFYRKLESLCDGILTFKSEEKEGRIEQNVRVSAFRGITYDSRWRKLELLDNGEVALAP